MNPYLAEQLNILKGFRYFYPDWLGKEVKTHD